MGFFKVAQPGPVGDNCTHARRELADRSGCDDS